MKLNHWYRCKILYVSPSYLMYNKDYQITKIKKLPWSEFYIDLIDTNGNRSIELKFTKSLFDQNFNDITNLYKLNELLNNEI